MGNCSDKSFQRDSACSGCETGGREGEGGREEREGGRRGREREGEGGRKREGEREGGGERVREEEGGRGRKREREEGGREEREERGRKRCTFMHTLCSYTICYRGQTRTVDGKNGIIYNIYRGRALHVWLEVEEQKVKGLRFVARREE